MRRAKAGFAVMLGLTVILVGACGGAAATPTPVLTPGPTARPPADPITIHAPAEASPGENISVSWTGKEQLGDSIYIVESGRTRIFATDDANGYNTTLGNPGTLVAPTKPGAYEIWFVEEETVDHIKARLPLTVR